jgi:S1-C subfamily serine protease
VNDVVPQLIAHGKVIRPGLGVTIYAGATSQRLRLPGVLIYSVTAGSGAELAGLRPTIQGGENGSSLGDVIVAMDGKRTPDNRALLDVLANYHVGDTVKVTIERDGKRMDVPVTLQAVDEQPRVMHRER